MRTIKYFFILVFTLSLFTLQSCTQNMQDVEKVKQQIEESNSSYLKNYSVGDAQAMAQRYAMDAIVLPPNAPEVVGKEAIVKLCQSFIDLGKGEGKVNTVKTEVFGHIAVNYHTYQFEVTMEDGQVIKDNGKSIVVYKEQDDGSWLIIYDIWNSNPPLPESN